MKRSRMIMFLCLVFVLMGLLAGRLWYIQIYGGKELAEAALKQQTIQIIVDDLDYRTRLRLKKEYGIVVPEDAELNNIEYFFVYADRDGNIIPGLPILKEVSGRSS